MKAKDIIDKLKQLDPDMDVLCYIEEDENIFKKGHMFRFLEIIDVSTAQGEVNRGEDGIVSMKFNRSDTSKKIGTIEVTSQF